MRGETCGNDILIVALFFFFFLFFFVAIIIIRRGVLVIVVVKVANKIMASSWRDGSASCQRPVMAWYPTKTVSDIVTACKVIIFSYGATKLFIGIDNLKAAWIKS